jgi:hypothetical protein
MIVMNYNGRKLTVRPTTRKGVSLDLEVNNHFVGSTRQGSGPDAQITALRKLITYVDRADNNRKPEKYADFWFETPFAVVDNNIAA